MVDKTEFRSNTRELCRQHRGKHPSVGVKLVQPRSPELANSGVRNRHTTHVIKSDHDWGCEESSNLDTWRD
jgi:hypothetical protein